MSTSDRRDLLLQAGMTLASELSISIVLQRIVDLATEVTGARYGALGVLGADGMISDFITSGLSVRERTAIGPPPHGRGLLGVLIHDATPLRLADISRDPRSVGFPPNHPPMKTFMGAPVKALGRIFGNIYLTEKRGGEDFTADDMDSLVVLATQAGVAIANAVLYEEARHRERWLEGLRDISIETLSGSEPEQVLDLICRTARDLAGTDSATIVLPAPGGDLTIVAAAGAYADDLLGLDVPAQDSISGDVIRTGHPLVLADASTDGRAFQPMVRLGHMGPAVFVPMRVGTRALGTLAVANVLGGRRLGQPELEVIEPFAAQAALVFDYGRTRRDSERIAIVDDRERIAKELHDGIIQSLFAVGMTLQATALTAGDDLAGRLEGAVTEIDRVIRDLRNYIFGLRPGLLADRQLDQAIRQLADEFSERSGTPAGVDIDAGLAALLASSSADIVQFVRESLSNVARHAQASNVTIQLAGEADDAVLTVQDDGQGFDIATARRGQGLGNLEERARRMGGTLEITSTPGQGVQLRATFPVR